MNKMNKKIDVYEDLMLPYISGSLSYIDITEKYNEEKRDSIFAILYNYNKYLFNEKMDSKKRLAEFKKYENETIKKIEKIIEGEKNEK